MSRGYSAYLVPSVSSIPRYMCRWGRTYDWTEGGAVSGCSSCDACHYFISDETTDWWKCYANGRYHVSISIGDRHWCRQSSRGHGPNTRLKGGGALAEFFSDASFGVNPIRITG